MIILCKNCVYWLPHGERDAPVGECHRKAPIPIHSAVLLSTTVPDDVGLDPCEVRWAITMGENGCGEGKVIEGKRSK